MTKRPNVQITNQTDGAVADYADERDLDKSEAYEELLAHASEFRPLSDEEHEELIDWVTNHHFGGADMREEAEHAVRTGTVTAIDRYQSGSPGYRGTLILAIFGYPETYTLFQYDQDGALTEVDREAQQ